MAFCFYQKYNIFDMREAWLWKIFQMVLKAGKQKTEVGCFEVSVKSEALELRSA